MESKSNRQWPGLKISRHHANSRKIKSLVDLNLHVREVNDDIVFNIKVNCNQVMSALKYLIEKSLTNDFEYNEFKKLNIQKGLKTTCFDTCSEEMVLKIQSLTPRQVEVLEKFSYGKTNKEIARDLNLEENTIKNHSKQVFLKLGVRSRSEAVAALIAYSFRNIKPLNNIKMG